MKFRKAHPLRNFLKFITIMKRFFNRAAILLAFGFATIGIVSCNSDVISTLLNTFFGQVGETYTYNLTDSKAQAYVGMSENDNTPQNMTDVTPFQNQQVSLICRKSGELISGKLIFPNYLWESIQVKNLVIDGLSVSTTNGVSTLKIDEQKSTINGTFEYNGQTYTAFDCELSQAQVTTNEVYVKGMAFFAKINTQGNVDMSDYQQLDFEMKGTIVPSVQ